MTRGQLYCRRAPSSLPVPVVFLVPRARAPCTPCGRYHPSWVEGVGHNFSPLAVQGQEPNRRLVRGSSSSPPFHPHATLLVDVQRPRRATDIPLPYTTGRVHSTNAPSHPPHAPFCLPSTVLARRNNAPVPPKVGGGRSCLLWPARRHSSTPPPPVHLPNPALCVPLPFSPVVACFPWSCRANKRRRPPAFAALPPHPPHHVVGSSNCRQPARPHSATSSPQPLLYCTPTRSVTPPVHLIVVTLVGSVSFERTSGAAIPVWTFSSSRQAPHPKPCANWPLSEVFVSSLCLVLLPFIPLCA